MSTIVSVVPSLTLLGNFALAEKYYSSLADFSILGPVQCTSLQVKQDSIDPNSAYYAVIHGNKRKYYARTKVMRRGLCDWCRRSYDNVTIGPFTVEHLGVINRQTETSEQIEIEIIGEVCSDVCMMSASRIFDVCRSSNANTRIYEERARIFLSRMGSNATYAPNPYMAPWNGGELTKEEYLKPVKYVESHVKQLRIESVGLYYELSKPVP
jgi:hypothetical protein